MRAVNEGEPVPSVGSPRVLTLRERQTFAIAMKRVCEAMRLAPAGAVPLEDGEWGPRTTWLREVSDMATDVLYRAFAGEGVALENGWRVEVCADYPFAATHRVLVGLRDPSGRRLIDL